MSAYWLPCPGNRNAGAPSSGAPAPWWIPLPSSTGERLPGRRCFAASSSLSAASGSDAAANASREGCAVPRPRPRANSASEPLSARAAAASSRAAPGRSSPRAAPSTTTSHPDAVGTGSPRSANCPASAAWYAGSNPSSVRCAFVPPKPNELTEARRGSPSAFSGQSAGRSSM